MPTEKNAAFLPTQYSFKLDRQRVKPMLGVSSFLVGVRCNIFVVLKIVLMLQNPKINPFIDEAQTALFKDPVCTSQ